MGTCPGGTDVRGWITTIAQAEAYGRTPDQAYALAWETITDGARVDVHDQPPNIRSGRASNTRHMTATRTPGTRRAITPHRP